MKHQMIDAIIDKLQNGSDTEQAFILDAIHLQAEKVSKANYEALAKEVGPNNAFAIQAYAEELTKVLDPNKI